MWRHIASNVLTILIVLLVAVGGAVAWGKREYVRPGPLAQGVCLRVEQGDTMRAVSARLSDLGAIRSGYIFRTGADYTGKSADLKFGSYLVPQGASMADIVGLATQGGQSTCGNEINYRIGVLASEIIVREFDPASNGYVEAVKFDPAAGPAPAEYAEITAGGDLRYQVTLAEGVTSWQVVEALKAADFLTGEVEEVPPEGSLAPQGYEVKSGSERGALLAAMAERQAQVLAEAWAGRAADLPYATPEEALVMASIVEKETGIAAERGLVASVFINRLRDGMKLQTDPAVIYGITKGQGALGRGLRQSELRKATPYNTYVIDGLPPTPIANPGAESIRAALTPAASEFLFFVADGTGGHAFAATLAEHNENVARWREIEAQQQDSGN